MTTVYAIFQEGDQYDGGDTLVAIVDSEDIAKKRVETLSKSPRNAFKDGFYYQPYEVQSAEPDFKVSDLVTFHDPEYGDFDGEVQNIEVDRITITGPRIDSRSWQWVVDKDRVWEFVTRREQ